MNMNLAIVEAMTTIFRKDMNEVVPTGILKPK